VGRRVESQPVITSGSELSRGAPQRRMTSTAPAIVVKPPSKTSSYRPRGRLPIATAATQFSQSSTPDACSEPYGVGELVSRTSCCRSIVTLLTRPL
jgi:hypothetical protein